jgi:hypothetical protein
MFAKTYSFPSQGAFYENRTIDNSSTGGEAGTEMDVGFSTSAITTLHASWSLVAVILARWGLFKGF